MKQYMQSVNPGTVGISYHTIDRFLETLKQINTEPHAILATRHGQIFLEGYWAPYGKGVIHGCQSLTKTVTGIALGAAMQENILTLDDKLIDIFPEYRNMTQGSLWWNELQVRHIATMSAGMDTQPEVTASDWIERFFQTKIDHRPGTSYFYNSIGCSMVGACIRRRTGMGLLEFMSGRILKKIGIDPEHLIWHKHADGLENGSGGLVSTVYDNALFMELYRCRGIWRGERLLSKQWVDFALQEQNIHTGGEAVYGGLIWIRKKCFVADGAMGQWAMLFPKKDIIVSIQQTLMSSDADKQVREAIFNFVDEVQEVPIPWHKVENELFKRQLSTLCIPAPVYGENHKMLQNISGKTLYVISGKVHFFADDLSIFDKAYESPVISFGFKDENGDLLLTVTAKGGTVVCPVAFKGYRTICNLKSVSPNPVRMACVTGSFSGEGDMCFEIRWLESCRIHHLLFHFTEEGADIISSRIPVGGFDVPDETARAIWK